MKPADKRAFFRWSVIDQSAQQFQTRYTKTLFPASQSGVALNFYKGPLDTKGTSSGNFWRNNFKALKEA